MRLTIEAPNGAGRIIIEGSAKRYTLETSFIPFGNLLFIEELEKRMHVKKVERTPKGAGLYHVVLEPENFPATKDLTINEIVTEVMEESKVFEV